LAGVACRITSTSDRSFSSSSSSRVYDDDDVIKRRRFSTLPSNISRNYHHTPLSCNTKGNIDVKTLLLGDSKHPTCNIPTHIAEKVRMEPKLYQRSPHPLYLIKQRIEDFFGKKFASVDSQSPIVTTYSNFDSLLIPSDHVSRSQSDTYYVNDTQCLRTHTSAHQTQLLQQGYTQFLCTGDVYRRDDIDRSHYPIFHQMEGVKVFDEDVTEDEVMDDLKHNLEGLAQHLFGPTIECRWVDEYFPFTHPSLELEVRFGHHKNKDDDTLTNMNDDDDDEWLEVLGCGVMRPEILQHGLQTDNPPRGWAFGLGLERLAMILFQIPDIRLFWTEDERFWKQFHEDMPLDGSVVFQPYSKYPPCYKDVSFWLSQERNSSRSFHVNELLDLVRGVAGDLVENVELVDQFVHPKTNRESRCYRITYRSMDRSLTNEEIDQLQEELRNLIGTELNDLVELR
jgi:phenylalanyl-tRNA synthetase alpha chain